MRVLGVIPARGGSKRLPRKNIKKLLGIPLIGYTIAAASAAKQLTDVVFTTDDAEIKTVAEDLGAFCPFLRPSNLATDNVRNSASMLHALEYMEKLTSKRYDAVVLLQPTSPLRTSQHIDEAVALFKSGDSESLAAVRGPYKKRDINLKRIQDGKLQSLIDNNEPYYIYNASIYIVNRDWLVLKKRFTSEDEIPYVMNDVSSIDVDEEIDFIFAEAVLKSRADK